VRGVEATQLKSGDYFGEMSFMATCRRFLKDDDQHMTDTGWERVREVEGEREKEKEREQERESVCVRA